MRVSAIALGAAATLLASCNRDSDKETAEALIRASMVGQGTIRQLDLSRQPDNNLAGTMTMQRPDGQVVRLTCTARRSGTATTGDFATSCGQVLDQTLLDEIEGLIRTLVEQRGGTVTRVEMARQDDDHATGEAEVRDPSGAIVRLRCTAARESNGRFNPRCDPVSGAGEPAPAPGVDEPAPTEEQPPEGTQ